MTEHPHDALVEMVLGHLDPQDQPGVTEHLEACAACRATAKQLLGVVDDVTRLAPVADPPAGFAERVLAGLDPAPLSLRRARRSSALRPWTAAAAAAALGLGVGTWRMIQTAPAGPSGALEGSAATSPERAFGQPMSLLTGARQVVGTASFGADVSGRAAIRVSLAGTPPASWYRCVATFADGTTTILGSWSASDGASWDLPAEGHGEPVALTLVTTNGKVWATASFTG